MRVVKQFGNLTFFFSFFSKPRHFVNLLAAISKCSVSQVDAVRCGTVLWLKTISLLGFLTVKVSDLSYVLCRLGPGGLSV